MLAPFWARILSVVRAFFALPGAILDRFAQSGLMLFFARLIQPVRLEHRAE